MAGMCVLSEPTRTYRTAGPLWLGGVYVPLAPAARGRGKRKGRECVPGAARRYPSLSGGDANREDESVCGIPPSKRGSTWPWW